MGGRAATRGATVPREQLLRQRPLGEHGALLEEWRLADRFEGVGPEGTLTVATLWTALAAASAALQPVAAKHAVAALVAGAHRV